MIILTPRYFASSFQTGLDIFSAVTTHKISRNKKIKIETGYKCKNASVKKLVNHNIQGKTSHPYGKMRSVKVKQIGA